MRRHEDETGAVVLEQWCSPWWRVNDSTANGLSRLHARNAKDATDIIDLPPPFIVEIFCDR